MPAPPKTSDAQIVEAARSLLESKGRDGFSMNDVAAAVGVRAPSLYRRFEDRAAILEAVELSLLRDLERTLAKSMVPRRPLETLRSQARAYRAFAKTHPNGYSLLFDVRSRSTEEGMRARAAALAPAMPAFKALVGPENALLAARVLTPFLHGFVSMEIGEAFRLGGGLDAAFEHGVATILHGLAGARRRSRGGNRPAR
ncbi:MAG: TetR/AcrR family transcriptional regulator [Steroidobacteraceae bacterium]